MRLFYLLIFSCFSCVISAQSLDVMAGGNPVFIDEFDPVSLKENQLAISIPFAKRLILNPEQKRLLNEKIIIKVNLIYTKYRTETSFNQKKLNKERLRALNNLIPDLFENRLWDFELTSQTNGGSREFCEKMFHGFVLTFRPNSTKEMLDEEADYIENLVGSMLKKDNLEKDTVPLKYDIKTRYDLKVGYVHDTIWYQDTVKPPSPPNFFYLQSLYQDTTVLGAFKRNKNWKNFIVVTDVTGSMSPYSAQVFVWLKGQSDKKNAQCFVFFNDGDETPSNKKKPLATKGVYVVENNGMNAVTKMATKCMRNGSGGGESMENDVEAILEGIKYAPKANEVVLIADNHEIMRDYKFIKKINKPVHVVLCGAESRINIQYLDLARKTKGSIHTRYSDVMNLKEIKEDEHFFIDEKEYMYKKGRFHNVYDRSN